ncbi:MAG: hydrogenase maturation nickel metallochaperone HypA [Clostridiales bacterium]|nr:hydrogenase maturation nickel metallochaperone HypA [Candidatus Crickella caballi]
MHEMGVVMAACDQIIAFAEENNISEIAEIVFAIGEGSGVFEPYVRKVYPAVVKDTMLEKTELVIETVPGMAECLDCFEIYNVLENEGKCPECGSKMKEILSGTEFAIKEIHVPED